MEPDVADPQQTADRRSLWRAAFAALALHAALLYLLLLSFSTPAPEAPVISRIKLVIEGQSHGAAGAAGSDDGNIAAQGEQSSAPAVSSGASASAPQTQSPDANAKVSDTPPAPAAFPPAASAEPALPEPMAVPSPTGTLPPMPAPTPARAAPPEPQHKPKPPTKPTIVQLTPPAPEPTLAPLPVPAPPPPAMPVPGAKDYSHLPDEVSHWASNTRSDTASSNAAGSSIGGSPSADGAGGHGRGAAGSGSAAVGQGDPNDPDDDYLERLRRYVEPYKKYPAPAIEQKREGSVIVSVTIDRSGTVLGTMVEQSSGSEILDRAALQMFRDASPVPPPPDRDVKDQRSVKMQINFKLGTFERLFR